MRAFRTSLVIKAGEMLYTHPSILSEKKYNIFFHTYLRAETLKPIMPRTEAVSVALSSLVRVLYHLAAAHPFLTSPILYSYDEDQERQGIVYERLKTRHHLPVSSSG